MKFKQTFLTLMLSVLTLFTFVSCADTVNNDEEKIEEVDVLELKQALYNKILGSWKHRYAELEGASNSYYNIVFALDSITFDGVTYPFDLNTNFFLKDVEEDKIPEEKRSHLKLLAYINIDGLSLIDFDTSLNTVSEIRLNKIVYFEIDNSYDSFPDYFVRVADNNGGSVGTLDFSVVGDWKYTISAGNTKTTFSINNDGTFTFKKNSDVTNGSYSLNGNKVTFSFEKGGQEIEDTFTISGSEDAITLTLVESKTVTGGQESTGTALSNMLLSFYTIIDTSVTLSK